MKIVKELPRSGKGWSGGMTIFDGRIFESNNTMVVGVKDMESGKYVDKFEPDVKTGVKDISYDRFSKTFWVTPAGGYGYYKQIRIETGKTIRKISRPKFGFGLFADHDEPNVIWCADGEGKRIVKKSTSDGREIKSIPLSFGPRGVARQGDTLWCSWGEYGVHDRGILNQVDMDGKILSTLYFPKSTNSHNAGGMEIDDEGYLWVMGGKTTSIYKIDISEYSDQSPTDPPTPTDPPDPTDPPEPEPKKDLFKVIWGLIGKILGW